MRFSMPLAFLYAVLFAGSFYLSGISETAAWSVLSFTGAALLWHIGLLSASPSASGGLKITFEPRAPHIVQALLQLCIYFYWSLYWSEPARYAAFIAMQLAWAYMIDHLFSFTRRREWRIGFGPVPIVLSMNLFIWFRPEYFYLQLVMVTLTYVAKEFFTRTRDGRTRHIFNPSAFSLSVAAVFLLSSGSVGEYTTGVDLVESFELPPNFYEVIFLLGLVVQILFATTPITLGAVAAHFGLFYLVSWYLGGRSAAFPIDRSIFLAMTLLVPDPATTPKLPKGRLLFGIVYGASVFAAAMALKYARLPDFYSKILVIPALNLLVPLFDRFADRLWPFKFGTASDLRSLKTRTIWAVAYAAMFLAMLAPLKAFRSTPLGRPWLQPVGGGGSPEMEGAIINMLYCQKRYPEAYKPFAFRAEFEQYSTIRQTYDTTLTTDQLDEVFRPEKAAGTR